MTKMMKEAIEILRELPEERQETIARAILDFASHDEGVYHLTETNAERFVPVSPRSNAERSQARKKSEAYTSASVYECSVLPTRAVTARVGA